MNPDNTDQVVVLSLVASHIGGDAYATWVPAYHSIRWCPRIKAPYAVHVGGHFRRLAKYKELTAAVMCACQGVEMYVTPRVPTRPRGTPKRTARPG